MFPLVGDKIALAENTNKKKNNDIEWNGSPLAVKNTS